MVYLLEKVRKVYDGRCVLDVERLVVQRGEILAVVGPSGAGKSTLLRLLNFLEPPDAGTIVFQGHRLTRWPVPLHLRRQVTTVFQRPVLLSTTVANNVAYGLRLRGMRDGRGQVQAMLERLRLADLAHTSAKKLSGGEAQRVALARALILHPAVLLLDEPTANLDPYNVGLIEDAVREMNQRDGTTVVWVTHNLFQARRLAHRVAFLLNGSLVEVADAETFFTAPRDPRARAFVQGEMVW